MKDWLTNGRRFLLTKSRSGKNTWSNICTIRVDIIIHTWVKTFIYQCDQKERWSYSSLPKMRPKCTNIEICCNAIDLTNELETVRAVALHCVHSVGYKCRVSILDRCLMYIYYRRWPRTSCSQWQQNPSADWRVVFRRLSHALCKGLVLNLAIYFCFARTDHLKSEFSLINSP